MDLSRRQLLLGRTNVSKPVRLPWTHSETIFTDRCTRCGECVKSCPQQIVVCGSGGFPEIDFSKGECTFCGDCHTNCNEPLFDLQSPPWQVSIVIDERCLTQQGVVCQNCRDACTPHAIFFHYRAGPVAQPDVNLSDCTGCGACISPCPTNSIELHPTSQRTATP